MTPDGEEDASRVKSTKANASCLGTTYNYSKSTGAQGLMSNIIKDLNVSFSSPISFEVK